MTEEVSDPPLTGNRQVAAEAPPPVPATTRPGRLRRLLHVTLPGCWGAVVFACLSLTPSLLPRGGFIQGLVSGITAAIGYGMGVLVAWLWRAYADRDARVPKPSSWRAFLIIAGVLVVVFFALGQYWQHQIRALMGVTEYNIALVVLSPFVAVFFFALFLAVSRGIRRAYHWVADLLARHVGRRAASATGWVLVTATVYLVVSGVLLDGLVSAMDEVFSVNNTITQEGVVQPTTGLRSGGPGSKVAWSSLGREGRTFAGTGPTPSDIEAIVHHPAKEPIRTYAGLDSADDTERLGRPGARRPLRVPERRRRGQRGHPVLIPAVVAVVPRRPVQGAGGRPGALRRGLRPVVEAAPGPASEALRLGREPGHVRRRDRLQRRVRPAKPHRRHGLRGAAQLQHSVPRVQRPPRCRHPRDPAGLQERPNRTVRERRSRLDPARGPALGRHPRHLPHASLRPHRLVVPAPGVHRAGLDQGDGR